MKKVIGLTGGIAAGKSTVSTYLKNLGYTVVDADVISREISAKGTVGLNKIIAHFGEEYLNDFGELDRKKLGSLVFGDEQKLAQLEAITMPLIKEEIERQILKSKGEIVFVDGATIIENGLQDSFHELWLVGVDEETQIKRLCARDHFSLTEAKKRIKSQMPLAEKRKFATFYIDNTLEKEKTYQQVDERLASIQSE